MIAANNAGLYRVSPAGAAVPTYTANAALAANNVTALTVDSQGRAVTAEFDYPPAQALVVRRFMTDGHPDPAFGTGGVATFTGVQSSSSVGDVAVDGHGRIVLLYTRPDVQYKDQCVVTRLSATGAVDTTFGTAGTAQANVPLPQGTGPGCEDLHVLADDGLLVTAVLGVVHLNSSGSQLGYGGGTATAFTVADPLVSSAVRTDGSIVLGLDHFGGEGFQFGVQVLTPAGVPDTSFSTDGVDYVGFGNLQPDWSSGYPNSDRIGWVGVTGGGSILAGGKTYSGAAFARWRNGGLDPSFGDGGRFLARDREVPSPYTVGERGLVAPGGAIYEFVETDPSNSQRVGGVIHITAFAPPTLVATASPTSGPQGTTITVSGSGCPGASGSADAYGAIENQPGQFGGLAERVPLHLRPGRQLLGNHHRL